MKNKTTMYVVMRHDFDGKDVVVACSDSYEKAQHLMWEYTGAFHDKGVSEDESYFYTTATTYYVG